ncbi:hypothetical protein pb186bvf_016822 [Paramecium bursaria]
MDDSQESINSQELDNQIQKKLGPNEIYKQIKQDQYDKVEKIDYLQFKEQTMLKRLVNLREEQKEFLQDLEYFQNQLTEAVKYLITQIRDKSKLLLQDQENDIRFLLKEIQDNKTTIQQYNDQIKASAVQSKPNIFQNIKLSLQSLKDIIKNWPYQEGIPIKTQQSPKKEYSAQKQYLYQNTNYQSGQKQNLKDSVIKVSQYFKKGEFSASKSPLKELNSYLQAQKYSDKKVQDLDQFINALKNKINNPQKAKIDQLWNTSREVKMNNFFQLQTKLQQLSPPKRFSPQIALTKQSYDFIKYRRF